MAPNSHHQPSRVVGASGLLPPSIPPLSSFNHLASQQHQLPAHRLVAASAEHANFAGTRPILKSPLFSPFDHPIPAGGAHPQLLPSYSSLPQPTSPVGSSFLPNNLDISRPGQLHLRQESQTTTYRTAPPQLNYEELQRATPIAPASQSLTSSGPLAPIHNPFIPAPGVLYNQQIPHIDQHPPAGTFPVLVHQSSVQNFQHVSSALSPLITSATTTPTPPPSQPGPPLLDEEAIRRAEEKKKAAVEKRRQTFLRNQAEKKRLAKERALKAAATRKKKREEAARLEALDLERHKERLRMEVASGEPLSPGDSLRIGDRVFCRPSENFEREPAEVVAFTNGRIYVHFVERDRRMDRWVEFDEVTRIPASLRNACTTSPGKLTRAKSRQLQERNPVSEREVGNEAVARAEREREERTKVKNVGRIIFGLYQLDAWYYSPFPVVKKGETIEYVFMCEYCLKYLCDSSKYCNHRKRCTWRNPPGALLYNDPKNQLAVYEVDGMVNMAYCQRLTLLGKLFLDHKTLFFDVAPFLFYIVTIGGEVAGFFSKERPERRSEYNLACLLTLPQHQKKGIGRFLIALSYELGQREGGKAKSPERPLSDLGQVSYKSFWSYEILRYGEKKRSQGDIEVPVERVSLDTGIREWDVTETIKRHKIFKMWRGSYSLDLGSHNHRTLDKALAELRKPRLPLRPELLNYTTRMKSLRAAPGQAKSPGASFARGGHRGNSVSGKKRGRPKPRNSESPAPSPANGAGRISPSYPVTQLRRTIPSPPVTPRTPRTPRTPVRSRTYTPARTPIRSRSDEYFATAIDNFVLINTPEKVLAPPDSEEGLPTKDYAAFAKNLKVSLSKAREEVFKAAQQSLIRRHRTPSGKKNTRNSAEPERKIQRINGSTVDTPCSNSGGGGGKDIGYVSHLMDVPEIGKTNGADGNGLVLPRRGGGLVRGRMVSGFTQNTTYDSETPGRIEEEDDEEEEEENPTPIAVVEEKMDNVTEENPGTSADMEVRAVEIGGADRLHVNNTNTSEIPVMVESQHQMKGSRRIEIVEEEKPFSRVPPPKLKNTKQPIVIIDLLDTDDEA